MKIILGLGNPGEQYKKTRHNIGFLMIDKIKDSFQFPEFTLNQKFKAQITKGSLLKTPIILVKPQTFMNLSGQSVNSLLNFYKLSPADIIVIHDDIDISLGKYKLAINSSSAGHNGVQNIIDNIGTQEFKRFRIGIGETLKTSSCKLALHKFVLDKLSVDELKILDQLYPNLLQDIQKLLL